MSARLVVSHAARADTRAILDYLETHAGTQIALRYAVDFGAAIERIAERPLTGSPRRRYGVRVVMIDPYLMFYTTPPAADEVFVLRILHGSRDITRALLGSID